MLNTRQPFQKALPFTFSHNHKLRTQPNHNLYTSPRNYDFTDKKFQVEIIKSNQRISRKPIRQNTHIYREKSQGIKDRETDRFSEEKLKEAAQQKIRKIQMIKTSQYYSKTRENLPQFQNNFPQREIYKNKINIRSKQKQVRHYKQLIKNGYQNSEDIIQKMQITFNLESTETDQPKKEACRQYYNMQKTNKIKINRSALQIWKKRKMERQIKQKEGDYRGLIRSLSRKNEKQRSVILNKMKEVLNQLFVLKKQEKNQKKRLEVIC